MRKFVFYFYKKKFLVEKIISNDNLLEMEKHFVLSKICFRKNFMTISFFVIEPSFTNEVFYSEVCKHTML